MIHEFLTLYSKLSNKYVARLFLTEHQRGILENLHVLVQDYTRDERLADQLNASILKALIKLYVLNRNNMFGQREIQLFREFQECIESLVKTIVQLFESYNFFKRLSFTRSCEKCQKLLHDIISSRQTQESHERIDFIFKHLTDVEFLKYVFDSKSTRNHAIVRAMILHMGSAMDQKLI